ncbi:DNA-binding transcriptional regulator, LysR family [Bosea sp. 62]|uniref:LysR family transcriptional regulator n=1 Tax=unclassified Bosea (in: a-proteobacteria) TaxID=2653178 RepID=UPI001255866A|nr:MULTISPECIES: LysR family transcriptional regulator [unclassified Bosea (in: a-proteobacteria)]CAD5259571.1 DNA-binding transcriptional regulator, LysR family [Bosea sp. 46]CAD5263997.1 DNA-binding transcriptional regulator, LysR family [Bosea sp. 21B]CAD5276292.1 DNA-binding transcriptional regulator, LysR family [Bosea sp. 7B]VVT59058.1 DNA-binding transcriptional regulator, LysR family [Bosea sp. EC-HK365B]VXB67416.1 DNA-binding transcriptional regulator, LysR family [Bosea sp. 29B]
MAALLSNRSGEMEVFAAVVERGGFSAAAKIFSMTPSAVSKLVTRLEGRLGARLVNRSTRKLQLTAEGQAFHQRCVTILSDIAEAECEAAAGRAPRGRVRVNANVAFGNQVLLPLVPAFLAEHPELSVDLVFTDQVVDLIEERADIAIRVAPGPLRGNQLMARKIGESTVAVVASSDYLIRHGEPKTPADLAKHNLIGFNFARSVEGWPFRVDGALISIAAVGNTQVGDGEIARQLAVAGIGLARLGRFHVEAEIAAGRLVTVLDDFNPGDIEVIHAVYLGQGGFVPARMRAFIDFLARNVKIRA